MFIHNIHLRCAYFRAIIYHLQTFKLVIANSSWLKKTSQRYFQSLMVWQTFNQSSQKVRSLNHCLGIRRYDLNIHIFLNPRLGSLVNVILTNLYDIIFIKTNRIIILHDVQLIEIYFFFSECFSLLQLIFRHKKINCSLPLKNYHWTGYEIQ